MLYGHGRIRHGRTNKSLRHEALFIMGSPVVHTVSVMITVGRQGFCSAFGSFPRIRLGSLSVSMRSAVFSLSSSPPPVKTNLHNTRDMDEGTSAGSPARGDVFYFGVTVVSAHHTATHSKLFSLGNRQHPMLSILPVSAKSQLHTRCTLGRICAPTRARSMDRSPRPAACHGKCA